MTEDQTDARAAATLDAYVHLLALSSWAQWPAAKVRETVDDESLLSLHRLRSKLAPRVAFYLALESQNSDENADRKIAKLTRERDVAVRDANRAPNQLALLRRQLDDERRLRAVSSASPSHIR